MFLWRHAVPGLTSTASTSIAGSDKPKQSTVVGTKTRTITWKRGKRNCRDCKSDINQICETITDVYSTEPRIAQTDDVQTEIDPNTVAFLGPLATALSRDSQLRPKDTQFQCFQCLSKLPIPKNYSLHTCS